MRKFFAALALVVVAGSASAQFTDSLDPFSKGYAAPNPLLTSLVAYWKLEEASGTRVDQLGVSDLTATNAPGNAAGKIGNAIQLIAASSQYVSRASNATLTMGSSDFTIQAWVYLDTATGVHSAVAKGDASAANSYEYLLHAYHSGLGGAAAFGISDGSDHTFVTTASVSPSAWHHILAWSDHTAGKIFIELDGVQASTNNSRNPISSGQAFNIGRSTGGHYLDGRIDEVAIWKRILTSGERAQLYNSGNGYALYAALHWWWMDGRRVA